MSLYEQKNVGNSGVLTVADDDAFITFTIKANTPVGVTVPIHWTYTINGVISSVQTYNYVNDSTDPTKPTRRVIQSHYVGPTTSEAITWHLDDTGEPEFSGPNDMNVYIRRENPPPTGLVRVKVGTEYKQAIPYVKDGGVWKQVIPYAKMYPEWAQTF